MQNADKTLSDKNREIIRVSISEAARLFGVTSQTIRRAIKAKELIYIIVGGRYKLNFESLVKWSQHHTTIRHKLLNRGIGQFVDKWKIKNPLYSPNPKILPKPTKESIKESPKPMLPETTKTDTMPTQ